MLLLAGIGSLVVIDELDAEKVHGIITHTDGERMYIHFFLHLFRLHLLLLFFSSSSWTHHHHHHKLVNNRR